MKLLFNSLLLLSISSMLAFGQKLRPFSPFDSTLIDSPGPSMVRTSQGYLIHYEAFRFPGQPPKPDTIHYLNEEGDLMGSTPLPPTHRHLGFLFESSNRYFFTGVRYAADPPGTKKGERVFYEFDAQGKIIRTVVWPGVMPDHAGFFGWRVSEGFQRNRYASATLRGDTLCAIFDYYVWPPSSTGYVRLQFEKLGLDGSVYRVIDISPFTNGYMHAEFTEDQIFVFGPTSGYNYPGTFGSGSGSVGRYNYDGNFLGVLSMDDLRFRQFVAGSCNYYQQRFYCNFYNYFGAPFVNIDPYPFSGCNFGKNVILDIRDKNFFPITGTNLPECEHWWSVLGRAFAVSPEGDIYYATYKHAQTKSLVLYKFDSNLKVKWQVAIPNAIYTAFVEPANDGGALLGTYWVDSTNYRFRLLRVFPDGQVSQKGAFSVGTALAAFPNPTTDYLYFSNLPGTPVHYELINAQGQVVSTGPLLNSRIDLTSQPGGYYVLRLTDEQTGSLLAVERIIKR